MKLLIKIGFKRIYVGARDVLVLSNQESNIRLDPVPGTK